MGLGAAGANAALDGLVGAGHYVNVCTGDPGTTGAHEAAGGSNARQSITWPSASGSEVTYATAIDIPVAAGIYTHWAVWSAATGGSFVVGGKLARPRVLAVAGTVRISQTQLLAALASQ